MEIWGRGSLVKNSEGMVQADLGGTPVFPLELLYPLKRSNALALPLCFHWSISRAISGRFHVKPCDRAHPYQTLVKLTDGGVHKFTPATDKSGSPAAAGPNIA